MFCGILYQVFPVNGEDYRVLVFSKAKNAKLGKFSEHSLTDAYAILKRSEGDPTTEGLQEMLEEFRNGKCAQNVNLRAEAAKDAQVFHKRARHHEFAPPATKSADELVAKLQRRKCEYKAALESALGQINKLEKEIEHLKGVAEGEAKTNLPASAVVKAAVAQFAMQCHALNSTLEHN
jgi:hypothetical protein